MIRKSLSYLVVILSSMLALPTTAAEIPGFAPMPDVDDEGSITTPSFELPFSSLASKQARESFVNRLRAPREMAADLAKSREITNKKLEPQIEALTTLYPFSSTRTQIGGVPVEIFLPNAGVATENTHRVLIELHGGGFVAGGGGPGGAVESIPIAGEGRFKVIAVDYRLGPENKFPAASEDVAAVYRELLKEYRPENIGIFGCSAGGLLSAQSIPWFLKEDLPIPGAIGIFCASTHAFDEGDSAQVWSRMGSVLRMVPPKTPSDELGALRGYLAGVSASNPLAIPSASSEVLNAFPPTLFLTGTRAPEMSGAAQGHVELLELGVESQLVLFDGLDHGFFSDPSLPESITAYKLISRFFDKHLGDKKK